ncbi:MAG: heparinase II/III family protein [Clostridia bacterium]|nr:heparinase II/III family protein [Clostridia bacterium]
MNRIPINYAEAIIEPFWDSGESYPEHEKYSRLDNYTVKYLNGALCSCGAQWYGNFVTISKQPVFDYAVSLERCCELDIGGYDILRFCVAMSSKAKCRITCVIDGRECKVTEFTGIDKRYEYDGKINGKKLTKIKLEFMNLENVPTTTVLYWLGLVNSEKEKEMKSASNGFDTGWEGCFTEEFEISPATGLFFDDKELEKLRSKMETPQFKPIMEKLRKQADSLMEIVPEEHIGQYYRSGNQQVGRCYEYGYMQFTDNMRILAYVGILDRNTKMLKMACRNALSLCCYRSWEDNFMCDFPGSTWSRRSFVISACCSACAFVLDLAGDMLTWHGKNIIYNALALKGLPRLESDFNMIEYIRHCNQGVEFSVGRLSALIALSSKYPRYKKRIDEAWNDLCEILDSYITKDGGAREGAAYWDYTIYSAIPAFMMMSRYYNKSLCEVIPDSVKRSEKYALACLTDTPDFEFIPYNDAHYHKKYQIAVDMLFCKIGKSDIWKEMYKKNFNPDELGNVVVATILAPEFEETSGAEMDDFITVNDAGQTSVRFWDEKTGKVHLHLLSGETYFAHAHSDKGSFVLEVNGDSILIDRGTAQYCSGQNLDEAQYHNLLCPLDEAGIPLNQPRFGGPYAGIVTKAYKENNRFYYETDLKKAWSEDVFEKNIRKVEMPSADKIIITDEAELKTPGKVMFILNTHGDINRLSETEFEITKGAARLLVITENRFGISVETGKFGVDDELKSVNRLCIISETKKEHQLKTVIKIAEKS